MSRRDVVLVVAVADNGVIGHNGKMPWHLPADLRHFKQVTMGRPVIMGRKTFVSIGRPLPGRHNIVLTRSSGWAAEGATVVPDMPAAILAAEQGPQGDAGEIMVIGGAQIYALARPLATRIELTQIHIRPEGDTFFETPDPAEWRETAWEDHPADGTAPAHSFLSYVRHSR